MKPIVANGILTGSIALLIVAQLLIKSQVMKAGPVPVEIRSALVHFGGLLLNPWIVLAYALVLLSAIAWMAALSQLDLSYAYPLLN